MYIIAINMSSLTSHTLYLRAICGQVSKVVDFKPLAHHLFKFETQQELLNHSFEEVIQLAYRCPFVPESFV
jgi:hypothetical protein